ncbi:hypothetical protein ACFWNC_29215 [Streptomyces sp. NPDC058369]|uniref:hypothetical protein n=1 Tax=unclassified Streptomyces TaxID=2593676 RepID=UPI00224DB6C0|nr:hypothetical protein [Streptomyces sp. NBC_01789]MCX4445880.1 hypothetical protein [Streptomyces sp. NBC_01789]
MRLLSRETPGHTGQGRAVRPLSRQAAGLTGRRRTVQAWFELLEAPGIIVGSAGAADRGIRDTGAPDAVADAARLAAQRALTEAGRGYLGGRLELRTHGPARATRDRRALRRAAGRAAALAVAATLRGDDTGVSVRTTRR